MTGLIRALTSSSATKRNDKGLSVRLILVSQVSGVLIVVGLDEPAHPLEVLVKGVSLVSNFKGVSRTLSP